MRIKGLLEPRPYFTTLEMAALSHMMENGLTECSSSRKTFTLQYGAAADFAIKHRERIKEWSEIYPISIVERVAIELNIRNDEKKADALEKIDGNVYCFNGVYLTEIVNK